MLRASILASFAFALFAIPSAGCSTTAGADEVGAADESDLIAGRAGAVYVASNDAEVNEVIVFRRAADGSLQRAAAYATSGRGSGDSLGSQGSLSLSADHRFLFVVNAGSNELSVFHVNGEALYLVDTVGTGGARPISVTVHEGVVYVLHAGEGHNDITGFVQGADGRLARLHGSTRSLSAPSVGPAQVSFSPSGGTLLVTEKMTNKVDEIRIDPYTGRPGEILVHDSSGQTPFGFATTQRGAVIVSEAFGGEDGASALSSYQLGYASGLRPVSTSIPTHESAACWVALAKNDRVAYTTNTKSGKISRYSVALDGTLHLLAGATGTGEDSKPTDLATSRGDGFLYVVNSGTATLGIFRVASDGSLSARPGVTGLPVNVTGLAAE